MSEARRQAEEMQKHLTELDATEHALRVALDMKGDYAPLLERMRDLNAHIRVQAVTLVRAVMAETAPKSGPTTTCRACGREVDGLGFCSGCYGAVGECRCHPLD